jgi:hypothetical protein
LPAGDPKLAHARTYREEGFYWVVLGQNPPEITYWERGANPQTHHGQRQHGLA